MPVKRRSVTKAEGRKQPGQPRFFPVPILIKDLKGGVVFSADDAWVQKQPSWVRGKDTNNQEWSIETGEADFDEN